MSKPRAESTLSSTQLNSQYSLDRISRLHKEGILALHTFSNIDVLCNKLDDRRILNNLRDVNLSDEDKEIYGNVYKLYTIVSATVLPPPNQLAIAQMLYQSRSHFFIGIDLEQTVLKEYHRRDAGTTYTNTNKQGRSTYRTKSYTDAPKLDYGEFEGIKRHKRLAAISNFNKTDQGSPINQGLFNRLLGDPVKNYRGLNELLLKININSMVFLGLEAAAALEQPDKLLTLILYQKKLESDLGVYFPLVIYNNTSKNITLNLIDSVPKKIKTNDFILIDSNAVYRKIKTTHPKLISRQYQNLWNRAEKEITSLSTKKDSLIKLILDIHQQVATILAPYTSKDEIIALHKKNKLEAMDIERYEEIDQKKLASFIMKNYFPSAAIYNLSSDKKNTLDGLTQLYNLQFRLDIYLELLETDNSKINCVNLEKDLKTYSKLMYKYFKESPLVLNNPGEEKTVLLNKKTSLKELRLAVMQTDVIPGVSKIP